MSTIIIYLLANTLFFLSLNHYMECFALVSRVKFFKRTMSSLAAGAALIPLELFSPPIAFLLSVMLPFFITFAYTRRLPECLLLPVGFGALLAFQFPTGLLLLPVLSGFFPSMRSDTKTALIFFFCSLLLFLVLQTACLFWKSRQFSLPLNLHFLLAAIPAISVIIYFIIALMQLWDYGFLPSLLGLSSICMMAVSNLIHFFIVKMFGDLLASEHQNELIVQEAHLKVDYYREVEQSNEKIRQIRHDLRNQLAGLYDSLIEGNGTVQEKLTGILGELEDTGNCIYTSNEILNSILKLKFNEAEKKSIRIEHDVMVPKHIKIEYGDMGILFGNLLDNAIEACDRLPEGERWLRLTVNYASGGLVLIVENSKDADDDVDLCTRKKRPHEHGIGIKSVRKVVEKYDGAIEFIDEARRFEASAIIYGM